MDASRALAQLIGRGKELRTALGDGDTSASVHDWQRDCAALVSELSGGMKAHWLSRAFSEALLVAPALSEPRVLRQAQDERNQGRDAASPGVDAPVTDIIDRIVDVLERGSAAIAQAGGLVSVPEGETPVRRRFDFVHDPALGPVLERAYADSRQALDGGRLDEALLTSCSILEAIITDALLHCGSRIAECGLDSSIQSAVRDPQSALTRRVAEWSFEKRIEAAEKAGLIRGGCARLPAVARRYRDLADADGRVSAGVAISERDARVAGQVQHVIMRDLDPGR